MKGGSCVMPSSTYCIIHDQTCGFSPKNEGYGNFNGESDEPGILGFALYICRQQTHFLIVSKAPGPEHQIGQGLSARTVEVIHHYHTKNIRQICRWFLSVLNSLWVSWLPGLHSTCRC